MIPVNSIKISIVEATGLAKDALHIYVALLVYLGACWLLGWKASQWKPLLLVATVAIVGEAVDMRNTFNLEGRLYPWGNVHDLWNTMLGPLLLFLAARFTSVFQKPKPAAPEDESSDKPEV